MGLMFPTSKQDRLSSTGNRAHTSMGFAGNQINKSNLIATGEKQSHKLIYQHQLPAHLLSQGPLHHLKSA